MVGGGQIVRGVCRMERQGGVVVVGREQIVSALCGQNGEAGRSFGCGRTDGECECCVQDGEAGSGDAGSKIDWDRLLPPHSPHRLYYSLQIVEQLAYGKQQRKKALVSASFSPVWPLNTVRGLSLYASHVCSLGDTLWGTEWHLN